MKEGGNDGEWRRWRMEERMGENRGGEGVIEDVGDIG